MKDSPLPSLNLRGLRVSSLFMDSTGVASTASEQSSVARHLTKVILLYDESY